MGQNVWHFVLGGSLAFVPKNEIMRATEINRNTFLLSDWLEEEKKIFMETKHAVSHISYDIIVVIMLSTFFLTWKY